MNPFEKPAVELLESARTRGNKALEGVVLPSGLDHFAVYAGRIGSALELAKLIQTEQRDLTVIDSHYKLAKANMEAAFAEVEKAMLSEFAQNESNRTHTFEMISQLIAVGQYEIASEFHKRLVENFSRSPLDAILKHRNNMAANSGSRLTIK